MLMRRQARGMFAFDGTSGHSRHGMVATVTGIAPYVSMARSFAREADAGALSNHQLLILQSASRSWELGYREELEGFARRYKWLRYVPTVSRLGRTLPGMANGAARKTSCGSTLMSPALTLLRRQAISAGTRR